MSQEGHGINEDDSLNDPELLMEVMELREELDEATSEKELKQIKEKNDGKCKV